MTWRAHIDGSSDFFLRSTRLILVDDHPDGSYTVLREGGTFTRITDGSVAAEGDIGFTVPSDALHALLAALSRHLGAVEHPEALRRDYDAERRRVDRLIGHLISGASA
jgi:hypothetical protein